MKLHLHIIILKHHTIFVPCPFHLIGGGGGAPYKAVRELSEKNVTMVQRIVPTHCIKKNSHPENATQKQFSYVPDDLNKINRCIKHFSNVPPTLTNKSMHYNAGNDAQVYGFRRHFSGVGNQRT